MDSQVSAPAPTDAADRAAPVPAPVPARDAAPPGAPLKPLTPRQERFCHYFVAYANAAHAAREAGFSAKSAKHQGYRLLRTGRVRARIRALHAELARDHGTDADTLIGKLEVLYRRASEAGRFHTATRAVELQARLTAFKERRRGLPAVPPLALPSLGRALPQEPPAGEAEDPEIARLIARAEKTLRQVAAEEAAAGREWGPEQGSASVGKGGHPVDMGSASGGPDVDARSVTR